MPDPANPRRIGAIAWEYPEATRALQTVKARLQRLAEADPALAQSKAFASTYDRLLTAMDAVAAAKAAGDRLIEEL